MAFSLDMKDKYMLDFEHDHGAVGMCAAALKSYQAALRWAH